MGFFPTDANDGDEIGPNANGSYFKYVAADNKWILIPNADVYSEAEVDALLHTEAHSIVSHNDTTATGAELETLTDGSETDLHSHAGGNGGMTYVDRGDLVGWDKIDFVCDGTYRDWDISAIVPAGAVAVHIRLQCRATAANNAFAFRKNGATDGVYNILRQYSQVANQMLNLDGIVACDANRVIEYNIAANSDYNKCVIRGWII